MPSVRSLNQSRSLGSLLPRFPLRTLAITFGLLIAGFFVFTLVDRFAPSPPVPAKPAVEKAAPEKPRKDPLKSELQPFTMGSLLVTAGMLAGAVAFIFVLKRFLKGSRHIPGGKKLLLVRDILAIGPKRAIYLIGLEHRNLVVGISGDQLTLLSEYSEESEAEALEAAPTARESRTGELAVARPAAPPSKVTTLPAPGAATFDAIAGDEVAVPPPEAAEAEASAHTGNTRAFSFAAVKPRPLREKRQETERIPHKFRQLLEQAADEEGSGR